MKRILICLFLLPAFLNAQVTRTRIQDYANVSALQTETLIPKSPDKVFVTTTEGLYFWDPLSTATDDGDLIIKQTNITTGRWLKTKANLNDAWKITGNTGTTAGTHFVGTTDAQDLVFKTNSTEVARFSGTTGFFGINNSAPTANLHTNGTLRFQGLGTNFVNTNILSTDILGNVTTRSIASIGTAIRMPISSLNAAVIPNTIDNGLWAQRWNWNTLATGTALTLGTTSMTSGNLLSLSNTNPASTGNTLLVTHNAGAGQAIRVNTNVTTGTGLLINTGALTTGTLATFLNTSVGATGNMLRMTNNATGGTSFLLQTSAKLV